MTKNFDLACCFNLLITIDKSIGQINLLDDTPILIGKLEDVLLSLDSTAKSEESSPQNTNDMPKFLKPDPLAQEKEKLAAEIADQLEMVSVPERNAVALSCDCSNDTVVNYGKRVVKIPLARRMLAALKKKTAGRQIPA